MSTVPVDIPNTALAPIPAVLMAYQQRWVADAAPLNRLDTDGSGIAAAPVAAGDTLVVVTRKGGVYGFRPD